jgi:hypothetical protein
MAATSLYREGRRPEDPGSRDAPGEKGGGEGECDRGAFLCTIFESNSPLANNFIDKDRMAAIRERIARAEKQYWAKDGTKLIFFGFLGCFCNYL